tara:strand:- start:1261 stop:2196 length:936 start_codon:yes stop_codon:yes gene_type:complete
MSILSVNNPYVDGGTVTSTNLNALVGDSTFASGSVDNITTVISGGAITVADGGVNTSQLNGNLQGLIEKVATTGPAGFAYVGGDKTGEGRGAGSMDVQGSRTNINQVASGQNSFAFGTNNRARGGSSAAIGTNNISFGFDSVSIGTNNDSSSDGSVVIGSDNIGAGQDALSIGFQNNISNGYGIAIGGYNNVSGIGSTAIGRQCTVEADYDMIAIGQSIKILAGSTEQTMETGSWTGITRKGSIRTHQNNQVAFTIEDSATAPIDGGTTAGAEPNLSLPQSMFTIQKDGDVFTLYFNDAGTIKSLSLGTAI